MLDLIVIGAGAAGTIAAGFAAAQGARVLLLESSRDGGRKILISGGGRCNVLPSRLAVDRFVTASNRSLLKKILRSWPLAEQRRFFDDEIGLDLVREEETGKLFPRSNRARDVRDRLIGWAVRHGVDIRYSTRVAAIRREPEAFRVEIAGGEPISCRRLILATGGLSVPKTGSDGFGLRVAGQLGLAIVPTYPALTPLIAEGVPHADLAGVSMTVRLRGTSTDDSVETEGGFLFTHRGYSGPSVLDLSHVVTRTQSATDASIRVAWTDLSDDLWRQMLTADGTARISTILREHLPNRLVEQIVEESDIESDITTSTLSRAGRERLVELLTAYRLPVTGDEGYKKAEVTGGGVALEEVDVRTMESKRVPGLYLCGEILDAFGPIGGHNFLWAWATGRAAGIAAGEETATQQG